MDSLNDFVNVVFGGRITVDQIITILVGIYAVIKSITEWRAKKKLINSERLLSSTEEKVQSLKEETEKLRDACTGLAEIVTTAYLSSNTIDVETKKRLAVVSDNLNKLSNIKLSEPVVSLIEAVESGANVDLTDIKNELRDKAEDAETMISVATDTAQAAIDKLKV